MLVSGGVFCKAPLTLCFHDYHKIYGKREVARSDINLVLHCGKTPEK